MWKGSIVSPPHTSFDNRFYSLSITTPSHPPLVRFVTKINLPCADLTTGVVNPASLYSLRDWTPNSTMQDVLDNINGWISSMTLPENKRRAQPGENDEYE